ncbi:antibiotic biosynthesis monooxygenase [Geodermatophilus sp. SYSU D01105]
MYARSTTIQGNPQAMDEGISYVRDEVMPLVRGMDGCIGLSMLADRASGRCIVTTAWRDADAMHASAEGVRSSRERAGQIFGGQPEVREWEIAVLHRAHEAPEGAWTRVTWIRGEPDQMDSTIDAYRMVYVPRMEEEYRGFCSMSVLVSRAEGMGVSAVTFESRAAMEAAREQARALRDEFATRTNVAITDVAEYELVLAHLRVPETV